MIKWFLKYCAKVYLAYFITLIKYEWFFFYSLNWSKVGDQLFVWVIMKINISSRRIISWIFEALKIVDINVKILYWK